MKNTEAILNGIQNGLNSEKIQSLLGEEFQKMDSDTKAQFMMFCLYNLAKDDENIMKLLAEDAYNELIK